MLDDLALSGFYGRKLDPQGRIIFPPNFKDEIRQKVDGDFYLLLVPKERDGTKFIRGGPVPKSYYDNMVMELNKRDVDDPNRRDFFSSLKVELDDQGRLPLTTYLIELVGFKTGEAHYFFGYGNYFDIYNLKDISKLVEGGIAELILRHEQDQIAP